MDRAVMPSKIDLKDRHWIWRQLMIRAIDVYHDLLNSKLNGRVLKNAILDQCDIGEDILLINCIVVNSTISTSVLNKCMAANCQIRDCVVKNSEIEDSTVKDCRVLHTLINRSTVSPASPIPHKRLPPEIREQIFGDVITWRGRTPPLIAALRGDPTLYHEALAILYKKHTFRIHKRNEESRYSAYLLTFKDIRSLGVDAGWGFRNNGKNLSFLPFPEQLCAPTMIRELHIDFRVGATTGAALARNFSNLVSIWLGRLTAIEKLSVSFDIGETTSEGILTIKRIKATPFISMVVTKGDACFGTQAIKEGNLWTRRLSHRGNSPFETYTWKAKYGQSLKWDEAENDLLLSVPL